MLLAIKIFLGLSALFAAWALLFRVHLITTFNRWMREYAFSDQWVIFSGRRVAVLLFFLGALALFSGLGQINDNPRLSKTISDRILKQATEQFVNGEIDGAVRRCLFLLKADGGNANARDLLAACYILQGNVKAGMKEVEILVNQYPDFDLKNGMVWALIKNPPKKKKS